MYYTNPNEYWNRSNDPYKGMTDNERLKAGCLQLACMMVFVFVAFLICVLFGSCTTERVITVERNSTDTLYVTKHQRDSIYIMQHDSIVMQTKGDTVTIDRWHLRDRWRDRVMVDTFYQSKTDTVYIEMENKKAQSVLFWRVLWQHKSRLIIILVVLAIALWIWKTK
jgi:hypothetical protein